MSHTSPKCSQRRSKVGWSEHFRDRAVRASSATRRTSPPGSRGALEVSLDRRSDPTRNLVGSHRRNGPEPQHVANEHESEQLAGDEGRASLGVVDVERSYELPHNAEADHPGDG